MHADQMYGMMISWLCRHLLHALRESCMAADLLQELGREEVVEDGGLLREHGQFLVGPAGQAVARHLHLPRIQPQVCKVACF